MDIKDKHLQMIFLKQKESNRQYKYKMIPTDPKYFEVKEIIRWTNRQDLWEQWEIILKSRVVLTDSQKKIFKMLIKHRNQSKIANKLAVSKAYITKAKQAIIKKIRKHLKKQEII